MSTSSKVFVATQEKVLRLNLDQRFYGSFAEIGAGQETAQWFFRTSGTAGTVAKTISAYDMTVSDALYGHVNRYVSEERLMQMMDYEYKQLLDRLAQKRGSKTCFFTFCSTVKSKGYRDSGPWSAWIGVRFQLRPELPPSDIIIHVRLRVADADKQKEVLGILGVNLLHALFYKREHLEDFVPSLGENLNRLHFEIDMVRFSGHGFGMFDNRILALHLVQSGLTQSAIFCADGTVTQPADLLYKRPIVLLRGSFMPLCKIHLEMMKSVRARFMKELSAEAQSRAIDICEISLSNLLREGSVDMLDFIDRVDALAALGKTVMVTNISRFHKLSALLDEYSKEPIAIALSIGLLNELFKEKWVDSPGGIFLNIAQTFLNQTKLYVTPWINRATGEFVTAGTYKAPDAYKHLYSHLLNNGSIIEVPYFNAPLLLQTPRDIIKMILSGTDDWRNYVPAEAERMIEHIKQGIQE